jgi:hypothetical protein
MGMFGKKAKPIVPSDVLSYLPEYGRREFERTQDQNFAPTMAMSKLQTDPRVNSEPLAAASEICQSASSQGGWALYGAWTAIHAFLPVGTAAPEYQPTMDESLRFLRGQNIPVQTLKSRMRMDAQSRWNELFPGDG